MISDKQEAVDRHSAPFSFFVITLFFAPLAFGTTETWSIVTVELLVAVTGFLYFFPFSSPKKVFYTTPGLVPLLLLLSWMYFQCLPLPMPLVRFISPNIFAAYQPVLELPITAHSGSSGDWIPLTVNRQATLLECLRLSSYTLFYLLTVQLLSRGRKLRTICNSVAGLTIVIVFLSVLQRVTAPDTLFWFRSLADGKTAFGPWVYKNQYAGFMVMTCPLVLAQFLLYRPPVNRQESIKEKFVSLLSMDGANLHLLLGFGTIIVLASIFLTQSRGGILSIAFTLLLYFLLLARKQERIQKLTPLVLISCLILIVGWFSWDPIIERFNSIFDLATGRINDGRLPVWRDTFRIIADFPVTGTGFGTFADIFPSYKTIADNSLYNHAHNDFLELLTDGGPLGFILVSWFIGTVLRTGYRQIFSRQDKLSVFFSIGAFAGISGLLVYSLTDFNLHNGANGLYFAFLCGLLVSAGHTRQYYRNRPSLLAPIRLSTGGKLFVWFVISFFLCAVLVIHGRGGIAHRYYRLAETVSASKQPHEKKLIKMKVLLEQARKRNPLAGIYPYALANISKYRQQNKQALRLYAEAAMKQPTESVFLQNSGLLSAVSDPSKGRALLESGYNRANLKTDSLQVWAEFELSHNNRGEAVRILRTALQNDPRLLKPVYSLLSKYSFTQDELVAVLPELTSAWINYWKYAKAENNNDTTDYFIEESLYFIDRESPVNPHYFMQVFHHYRQKENTDKAIEVLQSGIQRLPDYAPFRIHLGDSYMKQGIAYRAREEYEQALRLDPENTGIQNKIKKLTKKR